MIQKNFHYPIIQFKMRLTIHLYKDHDRFVAMCPELNTATSGETKEKAVRRLKASMFFLISSANEDISERIRDEILKKEVLFFVDSFNENFS